MTPSTQLTRTLRANLAASSLAKALYVAMLDTNVMPGQLWDDLPMNLRAGLIECCGRILLHLGPVNTHAAMAAAIFEFANELAKGTATRDPMLIRRGPRAVPSGDAA